MLLFVAVSVTTVSIVVPTPALAADCSAPVMVLGLRGSGEAPQGKAIKTADPATATNMGSEVEAVYRQFASSMSQQGKKVAARAILYPASPLKPLSRENIKKLRPSIDNGIATLMHEFVVDAAACPYRQYVLAGYSQGAEVIQEFLARQVPYRSRIAAVTLFGSPGYQATDPRAIGGKTSSGVLAQRLSTTGVTYCLAGDPICNSTASNLAACVKVKFDSRCPHLQYKTRGVTSQAASWLADVFGYSVRIEKVYVADGNGTEKTSFKCGEQIQYRVTLVNITTGAKQVLLRFSVARVGSSLYESSATVNTGPGTSIHFPKTTIPKGVSGKYTLVIAATDDYAGTTKATEFTVTC